jgi:hypothetical protein
MAQATEHETRKTTDHDEIRRWVEERGGRPAKVKGTEGGGDDPGILRIDFPGVGEEDRLEPISWEDFFEKFDEEKLAFLHQERLKSGEPSRFFKLVKRDG